MFESGRGAGARLCDRAGRGRPPARGRVGRGVRGARGAGPDVAAGKLAPLPPWSQWAQ
jgi:hypothetical protein